MENEKTSEKDFLNLLLSQARDLEPADIKDSIFYVPSSNTFSIEFLEEVKIIPNYSITDKNGKPKEVILALYHGKIYDKIKGLDWNKKWITSLSKKFRQVLNGFKPLVNKRFKITITDLSEFDKEIVVVHLPNKEKSKKPNSK